MINIIKKNSGHSCVFGPCGYAWYPGSHGIGGVPVAAIMDEIVVMTFSTWPDLWEDMSSLEIYDATSQHVVPEGSVMIYLRDSNKIPVRIIQIDATSMQDEMFGALMASSPTLVRITDKDKLVMQGWRYKDGIFYEPV